MFDTPAAARDPLHEPSLERLPPDAPGRARILQAHESALTAGLSGYIDPGSGFFVLSAQALLDRGSCCGCGCRHCPFTD